MLGKRCARGIKSTACLLTTRHLAHFLHPCSPGLPSLLTDRKSLRPFSSCLLLRTQAKEASNKDDRSPLDIPRLTRDYTRIVEEFHAALQTLASPPSQDMLGSIRVPARRCQVDAMAKISRIEGRTFSVACNTADEADIVSTAVQNFFKDRCIVSKQEEAGILHVTLPPVSSIAKAQALIQLVKHMESAKKKMAYLRGTAVRYNRKTRIEKVESVGIERIIHAEWKRHDTELRRIHEQGKKQLA